MLGLISFISLVVSLNLLLCAASFHHSPGTLKPAIHSSSSISATADSGESAPATTYASEFASATAEADNSLSATANPSGPPNCRKKLFFNHSFMIQDVLVKHSFMIERSEALIRGNAGVFIDD
ncbi:hypothetical protein L1887_14201 [Cichorium endivia]|nr:hypothetical protein L1887_14201 [Cichorium endivia]